MKEVLFLTLAFYTLTVNANDFLEARNDRGFQVAFQSQEMRKQICELISSPFSPDNIEVVYDEIKATLIKDDWAYETLTNVNQKMIKDVKSRCQDKMNLEIFSHGTCKDTCKEEFNKKIDGKIASYLKGKQEKLNLCFRACDAASISYNSAIRSLRPMYIKMNTLRAENPKCYGQIEVLDSRKEKYIEGISGKLYEIIDVNSIPK